MVRSKNFRSENLICNVHEVTFGRNGVTVFLALNKCYDMSEVQRRPAHAKPDFN